MHDLHDRSASPHPRAPARSAWSLRLAVAFVLCLVVAAVGPACASGPGGAPRRNGMEAPPPFPVAPDFNIPDSRGAPQSLGSLMGPRGLVLVLYRGHW